ncbi:hypothetical protein [Prolixibacter denitrificans]|uniref:Uncharacterized protein n=1 Tax=Prolixibacter denitrificans TaxID=1541063 RepID=A0A2P8CBT8_9BACT|nr:hypothetical protein [Prolixibacter denitrificans]PSK82415.1 hypothetical protein CLV93_106163 [Prolixibacter denitrificans]
MAIVMSGPRSGLDTTRYAIHKPCPDSYRGFGYFFVKAKVQEEVFE